jgi:hypothetical protein
VGPRARADEPQEQPARDYDAPDPNRTPLTYVRAAANVLAAEYVVWQVAWLRGDGWFYVTRGAFAEAFRNGWRWEYDGLTTATLAHPYGGGLYFECARAVGLTFWESIPYPAAASVLWEYFGERDGPGQPGSPHFLGPNAVITTSLGGIAIGEIMHRMSSAVLDDSTSGLSRVSREVIGAVVSPVRGVSRTMTGDAWRRGAPPIDKPIRVNLHTGIDRVFIASVATSGQPPGALFALDIEYGDLAPKAAATTLGPYEFFDFYAAAIASGGGTSGIEAHSLALLHGFSQDLSAAEGDRRDNNVLGFVQSMDFHGAELTKFSAFGLGLGDFVALRRGPHRRLRLGLDVQWAPLVAAASPFAPFAGSDRDYNYSTGGALGATVRWDIGRLGRFGLDAREYGTAVIDGASGSEMIGHARSWYEVDLVPKTIGLGAGSTFVHRFGRYEAGQRFHAAELAAQFYMTARL